MSDPEPPRGGCCVAVAGGNVKGEAMRSIASSSLVFRSREKVSRQVDLFLLLRNLFLKHGKTFSPDGWGSSGTAARRPRSRAATVKALRRARWSGSLAPCCCPLCHEGDGDSFAGILTLPSSGFRGFKVG